MSFFNQYSMYIVPGLIVAGGLVIGILIEKLILFLLNRIFRKIKPEGAKMLVNALKGEIIISFVIIALYIIVLVFDLPKPLKEASEHAMVVILIIMVSMFCARVIAGMVRMYLSKNETTIVSSSLVSNIIIISIYTMAALIILNYLNISIIPIITTLGVGGIAVALALQPTLSNLFSGFQLLVSKQIKQDDYVRLSSGEEGFVQDISWRYTKMRTLPGNLITIPNSKLADTVITNYQLPGKDMAVLVEIGVSYDSDLSLVESVTIDVARAVMKEVPGGVPDFDPFIRYHTLGDFSIDFTVILRVLSFVDQYQVKHEFIKRIIARYAKERIEIPYPVRRIISGENV